MPMPNSYTMANRRDAELRRLLALTANKLPQKQLDLYKENIPEMLRHSPWSVPEHAVNARKLAHKQGNLPLEALALGWCAEANLLAFDGYMDRSDKALEDAEKAFNIHDSLLKGMRSRKNKTLWEGRLNAALLAGEACVRLHKPTEAEEWYDKANKWCGGASPARARLLQGYGMLHSINNKHDQAHGYLREAIDLWSSLCDTENKARALHALGRAFFRAGMHDDAYYALDQSRKAFGTKYSQYFKVRAMLDLARVEQDRNAPDKAFALAVRTSGIFREIGDAVNAVKAETIIVDILEGQGEHERAFRACGNAYNLLNGHEDDRARLPILLLVGRIHNRRGESQAAILVYKWALSIANKIGDQHLLRDINKALYELHEKLEDFEEALQYHKSYMKAEKEAAGVEQQRLTDERRRDGELRQMEMELEAARNEIARLNRELLEARIMESSIPATAAQDLADILGDPVHRHNLAERWKHFESAFDRNYPEFLSNLRELSAAITPAETKVCRLAAIGKQEKEMAPILGIVLSTVQCHTYHARKKFGMEQSESFGFVMASLLRRGSSPEQGDGEYVAPLSKGTADHLPMIARLTWTPSPPILDQITYLDINLRAPAGPFVIRVELEQASGYGFDVAGRVKQTITRNRIAPAEEGEFTTRINFRMTRIGPATRQTSLTLTITSLEEAISPPVVVKLTPRPQPIR